jgi:hypothetical protein
MINGFTGGQISLCIISILFAECASLRRFSASQRCAWASHMISECAKAGSQALRAALAAGLMVTMFVWAAVAGPFDDADDVGQGMPKNDAEAFKFCQSTAAEPAQEIVNDDPTSRSSERALREPVSVKV